MNDCVEGELRRRYGWTRMNLYTVRRPYALLAVVYGSYMLYRFDAEEHDVISIPFGDVTVSVPGGFMSMSEDALCIFWGSERLSRVHRLLGYIGRLDVTLLANGFTFSGLLAPRHY